MSRAQAPWLEEPDMRSITLSPSPLVVAAADMDLTPVFGVPMKKHISEELLLLLEGLFVLELVKLL